MSCPDQQAAPLINEEKKFEINKFTMLCRKTWFNVFDKINCHGWYDDN